jgi:hypothetical protein
MACIQATFGMGETCVNNSDCYTKRCVEGLCAADNAPLNIPFPIVDAAPPPVDAAADANGDGG